ncbi:MutT/nudix family protein [Richelia intracellularis HH01]|jgi:8-oxo-dGTP pyrophosphatase MutT (NUDIX family)|uniref:MutT/nudix family protein n=1 Tax=Richelia intracellularis HH01 TaxID=1165094 RepID=M1X362_9NOST|nr:NUDIX domain-containing protein [Richelia intracellularis]CCH68020.1 MutT/nudix family protein [Richelia intracellularis HH01]HAE06003.1 NUDIX domain-containing protein [Richelia sp.]
MHQSGQIRLIALGLIRNGEYIFVSQGYDYAKGAYFYRALGGGVEFGENSLVALKREFQEEIQAELNHIEYLGCLENIFTYNGQPCHEVIQLYKCGFTDPKLYQLERLVFKEGKHEKVALWINIKHFQSGSLKLVPEEFLDYL